MPGGRPKLSDEEKLRRLAEKEGAKLAKKAWKAQQKRKKAEMEAQKPKRGAGRPAKSLAERVEDIRTGKVQVKNLYKDKDVFYRAIQFPKALTHALPAHIVRVLSERSATRQAVASDPDVAKLSDAPLHQAEELFVAMGRSIPRVEDWLKGITSTSLLYWDMKTLLEREKRKVSAKK